jgi:serine/threonine protein kinase
MEMIVKLQKERHIFREKKLLDDMKGKHFNIINLLGSFKDSKNLYFVFEYGPKGTLDDLIKKCGGRIPENIVKVLFAQLINFIEYLQ